MPRVPDVPLDDRLPQERALRVFDVGRGRTPRDHLDREGFLDRRELRRKKKRQDGQRASCSPYRATLLNVPSGIILCGAYWLAPSG